MLIKLSPVQKYNPSIPSIQSSIGRECKDIQIYGETKSRFFSWGNDFGVHVLSVPISLSWM
jgi:hypothetical protein